MSQPPNQPPGSSSNPAQKTSPDQSLGRKLVLKKHNVPTLTGVKPGASVTGTGTSQNPTQLVGDVKTVKLGNIILPSQKPPQSVSLSKPLTVGQPKVIVGSTEKAIATQKLKSTLETIDGKGGKAETSVSLQPDGLSSLVSYSSSSSEPSPAEHTPMDVEEDIETTETKAESSEAKKSEGIPQKPTETLETKPKSSDADKEKQKQEVVEEPENTQDSQTTGIKGLKEGIASAVKLIAAIAVKDDIKQVSENTDSKSQDSVEIPVVKSAQNPAEKIPVAQNPSESSLKVTVVTQAAKVPALSKEEVQKPTQATVSKEQINKEATEKDPKIIQADQDKKKDVVSEIGQEKKESSVPEKSLEKEGATGSVLVKENIEKASVLEKGLEDKEATEKAQNIEKASVPDKKNIEMSSPVQEQTQKEGSVQNVKDTGTDNLPSQSNKDNIEDKKDTSTVGGDKGQDMVDNVNVKPKLITTPQLEEKYQVKMPPKEPKVKDQIPVQKEIEEKHSQEEKLKGSAHSQEEKLKEAKIDSVTRPEQKIEEDPSSILSQEQKQKEVTAPDEKKTELGDEATLKKDQKYEKNVEKDQNKKELIVETAISKPTEASQILEASGSEQNKVSAIAESELAIESSSGKIKEPELKQAVAKDEEKKKEEEKEKKVENVTQKTEEKKRKMSVEESEEATDEKKRKVDVTEENKTKGEEENVAEKKRKIEEDVSESTEEKKRKIEENVLTEEKKKKTTEDTTESGQQEKILTPENVKEKEEKKTKSEETEKNIEVKKKGGKTANEEIGEEKKSEVKKEGGKKANEEKVIEEKEIEVKKEGGKKAIEEKEIEVTKKGGKTANEEISEVAKKGVKTEENKSPEVSEEKKIEVTKKSVKIEETSEPPSTTASRAVSEAGEEYMEEEGVNEETKGISSEVSSVSGNVEADRVESMDCEESRDGLESKETSDKGDDDDSSTPSKRKKKRKKSYERPRGTGGKFMKERQARNAKAGMASSMQGSSVLNPSVMDEETRMDANIAQDEDSQSSVSKREVRRFRCEVIVPESTEAFTADKVVEYVWPLEGMGEHYFIQEQISQYLGIMSFKRKYPDLRRRAIDMQERDYLKEQGLVTEIACDLGITAVRSEDVLDVMFNDFPVKFEELQRILREKKENEIRERGKVNYSMANIDKSKMQEYGSKAAADAARWNANLNKEKREERRHSFDLQTFTLQKPIGRGKKLPPEYTKMGWYPVPVLPGQYTDYYQEYTSQALKTMPLISVLANPKSSDTLGSDGASSDSDEEAPVKTKAVTEPVEVKEEKPTSTEAGPRCKVCNGTKTRNKSLKPEPLIICGTCRSASHPTCIDLTLVMVPKIESYSWQCMDCKTCVTCSNPDDEDKMIFCDMCDRGYHIFCVGLRKVPNGRWHCKECAMCSSCGSKTPAGNEHLKNAEWQHEFKKDKDNKQLRYATTLCVPCDKYWKRRQFCYVCLKVYRSIPEDGMVRCSNCPKYIHREGTCSTMYENERFCINCYKMRNSTALNHSRIIAAAKKKMASGY